MNVYEVAFSFSWLKLSGKRIVIYLVLGKPLIKEIRKIFLGEYFACE